MHIALKNVLNICVGKVIANCDILPGLTVSEGSCCSKLRQNLASLNHCGSAVWVAQSMQSHAFMVNFSSLI